eukprot:tig00000655_g2891.t1
MQRPALLCWSSRRGLASLPRKRTAALPSQPAKPPRVTTPNDEPGVNARFRATPLDPAILRKIDEEWVGRQRGKIPSSITKHLEDKEDEANRLFLAKPEFVAGALTAESLPPEGLPEVAFAGRSNVGKSSLINALARGMRAARVSDKPGVTQQLNFYSLKNRLILVDFPGYGFAFSKEERSGAWQELMKQFVSSRRTLRRVCLLVDARVGLKQSDREFVENLVRARVRLQVVLTKCDAVLREELARRVYRIREELAWARQAGPIRVLHPRAFPEPSLS